MTKYLIIDDEPLAHKVIEKYASDIPSLEKVGNCYDAIEAVAFLREHKVDLLFLDIKMPKLKGLEFLRVLANPPAAILTTAYKEYALEGYELDVVDYLLKPFSFERFFKAINKLEKDKIEIQSAPIKEEQRILKHIFIKTDKQHIQVALEDINYLEAYGAYVKVHLEKETLVTLDTLSAFEKKLPSSLFLRVHKSYVISKQKINRIEGNRAFIQQTEIPIGGSYKAVVRSLF